MPKLRGNRVFLKIPKKADSKLIVDENTKEALEKEMLKKMSKLAVHSVGDLVLDIKEGDMVLVEPYALQKALIIPLSDKEDVLLVGVFDIVMIW